MNSLRCFNCSLLNFSTAETCKRCGQPLSEAAASQWQANQSASSENFPPAGESPFWDQPAYQPSFRPNYSPAPVVKRSGGAMIAKVLIAVAVIGLVAFIAIPKLLKKAADYKNISWTEYNSPDGDFSLSLPAAPKIETEGRQTPKGYVSLHKLEAQVNSDSGCMLVYGDYPVGLMNLTEDRLYDYAVQSLARQRQFTDVGARRYITVGSHRGIEVEMKASPEMNISASITCRVFWVSPRIYILAAAGPDSPEFKPVQARCLDSFKLLK